MNCKQCNELLSQYIDLEVTPQDKVKIDQHLQTCQACKTEYQELKALSEMLKELPMKELPKGFEAELHEKLVQASQEMKAPKAKNEKVIQLKDHFKRNVKRYSLAVAASLVIMVSYESMNFNNSSKMEMAMEAPAEMSMDMAYEVAEEAPMIRAGESDGAQFKSTEESISIELTNADWTSQASEDVEFGGGFANEDVKIGVKKDEPEAVVETTMESTAFTATSQPAQTNRKIIQTGYLSMDIENYDEKLEQIMTMTTKMGGYVEDMSTSYQYGYRTENPLKMGHVTIRVPQVKFHGVIKTLDELGRITDQNMSSEDITHRYRDIANEVANLEVREAKLREIMEKAEEIKDVLQVENELSRVRGQINDMKGTLIQWDQLVSLSRITINLYEVESLEVYIEPIDDSLITRLRESFINSINDLVYSLENLAILAVALFPFIVGYSIVGFIGYKIVRSIVRTIKRRRK